MISVILNQELSRIKGRRVKSGLKKKNTDRRSKSRSNYMKDDKGKGKRANYGQEDNSLSLYAIIFNSDMVNDDFENG